MEDKSTLEPAGQFTGEGCLKVIQAISNQLQKLHFFLQTLQLVACIELVTIIFRVLC